MKTLPIKGRMSMKVLNKMGIKMEFLISLGFFLILPQMALATWCYECDSSNHFSCSEFWEADLEINSQYYINCSHVYDSNYCVKKTGIFDGKLGTKRFCSSRDWGNYCEYIERPGDIQEYRSCVLTCSTHGCNFASSLHLPSTILILSLLYLLYKASKF